MKITNININNEFKLSLQGFQQLSPQEQKKVMRRIGKRITTRIKRDNNIPQPALNQLKEKYDLKNFELSKSPKGASDNYNFYSAIFDFDIQSTTEKSRETTISKEVKKRARKEAVDIVKKNKKIFENQRTGLQNYIYNEYGVYLSKKKTEELMRIFSEYRKNTTLLSYISSDEVIETIFSDLKEYSPNFTTDKSGTAKQEYLKEIQKAIKEINQTNGMGIKSQADKLFLETMVFDREEGSMFYYDTPEPIDKPSPENDSLLSR